MGRKRAIQKSKTIGFKAFQETDADLLTWWDGLPDGERSQVLRDLIRAAIARQSSHPNSNGHGSSQAFTQVCEDIASIRTAITDLPGYLERIVTQVAVVRPVMEPGIPDTPPDNTPRLEQEAIDRRKANMRQNTW